MVRPLTPWWLTPAPTFESVQAELKDILKDKIIVGHALFHDLAVLEYRCVYEEMRDTALFYPLRQRVGVTHEGQYPALRTIAKEVLNRDIQGGEHCPVRGMAAWADDSSRTHGRRWRSSSPFGRSTKLLWRRERMSWRVCPGECV